MQGADFGAGPEHRARGEVKPQAPLRSTHRLLVCLCPDRGRRSQDRQGHELVRVHQSYLVEPSKILCARTATRLFIAVCA
jgi:hypothetical protein